MSIERTGIELADQWIPVKIIRKNNKHTYLRVRDGTVVVTTNRFTRKKIILDLIKKNEGIYLEKIEKEARLKKKQETFYFLGEALDVVVTVGKQLTYQWINEHHLAFKRKEKDQLEDLHTLFYRREGKGLLPIYFERAVGIFQKRHDVPTPTLEIRKMKSRYGTCYYQKNKVILNQKIIRYREEIIYYIIFHELTHFIHPNHSKAFYEGLSIFVPNHERLRKELNKT